MNSSGRTFWAGKRVLVTGHTGFKGGWLSLWLQLLGARATGIALEPDTSPNLYTLARVANEMSSHFADIRDLDTLHEILRTSRPEVVFHLAAQPLVRASYRDPISTFSSNVMGTVHVLEALRSVDSVRVAVMITTDKVYRNNEHGQPYREVDELGGHDPYSASKAASEIAIACYRDAFLKDCNIAVASARTGNVIGGGDWSMDRLIPDAMRSWQSKDALQVRRPDATRPWQHVLEPVHGYLSLAEQLWNRPDLAGPYNFGPKPNEAASVKQVIELALKSFGRGEVDFAEQIDGPHEAHSLSLDTAKAFNVLGLSPRWNLETSVNRTISWYRAQLEGADAHQLCLADIAAYENAQVMR
jgi:CDP-glucose 4,6-dehydratase